MARKLAVWGVVGVAAFYLLVSPTAAGGAVKHAGTSLRHAAHQVATFLRSVA